MHFNNYFVEHIRGDLRWGRGGGIITDYLHGPQGGPYRNFSKSNFSNQVIDDLVVCTNMDSSWRYTVDLQVNIVPSSGRHSQFSILVLHAACKIAERGTD